LKHILRVKLSLFLCFRTVARWPYTV